MHVRPARAAEAASGTELPLVTVLEVLRAVRGGDFSASMPKGLAGAAGDVAEELNEIIRLNRALAEELSRVSVVVGREGKLKQRATLSDAQGGWKECLESVNTVIDDLVRPSHEVGRVIRAVADGDLSQTMALEVDGRRLRGEYLRTARVVNGMVEQLASFASEVTRVAREVGTEGKLGGQARVRGVAGTWRDLTEGVNLMAGNLTAQVRRIAEVTTAVANGDLSKKITVNARGEILELKNTINTMVDQLNSFASEVTRVAREVGTEGKLGGQARVRGVAGTWKDLTDSVNSMASNLTAQVRNIAEVTTAIARGDLSKKITVNVRGEIWELKDTINTMVNQLNAFASEVTRVAREVGTEGNLGGQARVPGVAGTWKDLTDGVNSMASNLTAQVRNIAEVTTAVARGDLSKQISVNVKGEIAELKNTVNTMVDQLNAFASEVTRVAREVGTEGKLGGQARVPGVAGTWMDLTDNVNSMATNLTNQVRGIAKVVTAVAGGDLTLKLALEARGEIAELAETINGMTNTLAIFAQQVLTVAREVGVEGKLGGQAKVPGVAGTWRDLTDNVNELAANLTTQVRAIGDVATAVTKGDLTQYITVEASGEVAALKDHINEMIRNLKDTTQKAKEQDWLKTNLARFTRMLQGQRDLVTVAEQMLSELAPLVAAQHGLVYMRQQGDAEVRLNLVASYAASSHTVKSFRLGEGLVGQCARDKRKIVLSPVPSTYGPIHSGLGPVTPGKLVILPVLFEGQVNAVIELACNEPLSEIHEVFLGQLTESLGIVVNTIAASMRTEALLQQSQSLTQELQTQQEELRQTNERLEHQAATLTESQEQLEAQQEQLRRTNEQLEEKAKLLELKNGEVELAKAELEDKAAQLALTSKYKSEFLANMSHELRTPLNSLLILSKMLADNLEGNLTRNQVDFAHTIVSAGTDLLALINDILDLSKIESGTIAVDLAEVHLADLGEYLAQSFRHVASQKGLEFRVEMRAGAPETIVTDAKRLERVLKNLLSNAFKFTEQGRVTLEMGLATYGWRRDHLNLNQAEAVIAFSVVDTGIGIAEEKQSIIFEAFQQADGTTNRRYGGTGLGLSISREVAALLGGEIGVVSVPGMGSTFTFYVPRSYQPPEDPWHVPTTPHHVNAVPHGGGPSATAPVTAGDVAAPRVAGESLVLVVDRDPASARVIGDAALARGLKTLVVETGDEALRLGRRLEPKSIVLRLELPDLDGRSVLALLTGEPATSHTPVAAVTANGLGVNAIRLGAVDWISDPVHRPAADALIDAALEAATPRERRVLVVERDERMRRDLVDVLRAPEVAVDGVGDGGEALAALESDRYDCVLAAFGVNGLSALLAGAGKNRPPFVVHSPRRLGRDERAALQGISPRVIVRDLVGPGALLLETCVRLHRRAKALTEHQRSLLDQVARTPKLPDTKILVVDDDVRNIFAITSALEQERASVSCAENGRDALELLDRNPSVDAVLMDIMMPDLDGYEIIRRIRADGRFDSLPIVAVTAKAMQSDRDKCIEAGATDYISKPVDMQRLLASLRVHLRP